jgi:hypothetical protein
VSVDLTGQRFGKLTVIRQAEGRYRGQLQWFCVCDCGGERVVAMSKLRHQGTKSCGCLYAQGPLWRGHGQARGRRKTSEYAAFQDAKGRCSNPRAHCYDDYGGRGIEFRFDSFAHFFAELGPRPPGMTLDRIDNGGHYAPGNVRWASRRQQQNNKRNNRHLTAFGKTMTVAEWSRSAGIRNLTIWVRLRRGLPAEQVLREAATA